MRTHKQNNKMTANAYWLEILVLTIILGIMFYFWGFKNCLFMDRNISLLFFIVMDVASVLALGIFNVKKQRNNLSIWGTVLLPIEVYCVLSYLTLRALRIFVIAIVWVLLVLLWLLWKTYIHLRRGEEFRIDLISVPQLIRAAWLIAAAAYLGFLVPVMALGAQGIEVALDYTLIANETKGFTITGQQTNLMRFESSVWKKLDRDKKEEMLQLVADIESSELGLPHNLYIGIRDLSSYEVDSAYVAGDYKILIDENTLLTATGEELITIICHQAYHAYERSLADMYMSTERTYQKLYAFGNVEQYIAELQKNVQALDDRIKIASILETDAEGYASEKTEKYLYWINFAYESGK